MTTELEEHDLIRLVQERQEAAFRELVNRYQSRVYSTVLALLQNAHDAEDIAQEVFIEVYRSVGNFRGESALSTWIYRIATTKSLEFIRRKKTQKRFAFLGSLFGQNEELNVEPAEFQHPGIVAENAEMSRILFAAVNKLTETQRVAFTLVNIEGLSYQETAAVMETTVSSVESLLFRSKQNLRKQLKSYYENLDT